METVNWLWNCAFPLPRLFYPTPVYIFTIKSTWCLAPGATFCGTSIPYGSKERSTDAEWQHSILLDHSLVEVRCHWTEQQNPNKCLLWLTFVQRRKKIHRSRLRRSKQILRDVTMTTSSIEVGQNTVLSCSRNTKSKTDWSWSWRDKPSPAHHYTGVLAPSPDPITLHLIQSIHQIRHAAAADAGISTCDRSGPNKEWTPPEACLCGFLQENGGEKCSFCSILV